MCGNLRRLQARLLFADICAVIIACIGVPALMATPPPFTTYEEGGQIEILGQNVEGAYGFSFSPALTCAIGSGSAGPIQCTQAGGCFGES